MSPDPIVPAVRNAVLSLVRFTREAVLPAIRAIAAGLGPVAVYRAGYHAGHSLRVRDSDMPDAWHRGYLYGRLARKKERLRAQKAECPGADTQPRAGAVL